MGDEHGRIEAVPEHRRIRYTLFLDGKALAEAWENLTEPVETPEATIREDTPQIQLRQVTLDEGFFSQPAQKRRIQHKRKATQQATVDEPPQKCHVTYIPHITNPATSAVVKQQAVLVVKASKLGPTAGQGLFLKGDTSVRATIGAYRGRLLKSIAQVRASKSQYIVQFNDSTTGLPVYIDAGTSNCPVRYINETFHHVIGVYDDNCRWLVRGNRMHVFFDALTDILPHDTELYIRYGFVFWSKHTDPDLLRAVYAKYRVHMLDSQGYEYLCAAEICTKLGVLEAFKEER